ncbi:hypothetical protein GCM10023322_76370 [Rugosimonospora acidiphila]|uniref:Uncharacterized protein n=1 Tax=Rugosimonospora acidiphila TaxID=556531 RepID=A0ABP9SNU2_9ACTN
MDWGTISELATAAGTLVLAPGTGARRSRAGGQRMITRFVLTPIGDDDWLAAMARHRHLDRAEPR